MSSFETNTQRRRARDDLRRQIAELDRRLGELFASAFPRPGFEWGIGAVGGPRMLSTGELERVRDALALRLRDAQAELARRADAEEANRVLVERMIAAPERHRWVIVSNEDIGERGCRHWHSRPRWGILGMLLGWWRVRLSSGCPLAEGLRPPAPQVTPASEMAKKRRKRRPRTAAASTAPPPVAKRAPAKPPRKPISEERPPAPWGSFPLVELVVLFGLGLFVAGFFFVEGSRGTQLFATGLAIASLAGLELSIREHFAGFRSHSTLLSAGAGVAVMLGLYYLAELSPTASFAGGAAVGALCFWALARAFQSRAGRMVKLR
ncbi:MAG: MgtC/SapB family protein [Solirubrobacterales bacterium]